MMARYYDMDKLKEMTEAKADTLIEGKDAFLYVAKWLDLLPPADVAPRAIIAEIFEEIERACLKHIDRYDRYLMCCKDFDDLKKNYTGEVMISNKKEETSGNKKARAEAIKEFAEKIKTDAGWICDDNYIERALIEYIDNLVKEMTEEQKSDCRN